MSIQKVKSALIKANKKEELFHSAESELFIECQKLCHTCNIPMLQCKYYGGGIYWICSKCHCRVESTEL